MAEVLLSLQHRRSHKWVDSLKVCSLFHLALMILIPIPTHLKNRRQTRWRVRLV
jgi:hypothetical protein